MPGEPWGTLVCRPCPSAGLIYSRICPSLMFAQREEEEWGRASRVPPHWAGPAPRPSWQSPRPRSTACFVRAFARLFVCFNYPPRGGAAPGGRAPAPPSLPFESNSPKQGRSRRGGRPGVTLTGCGRGARPDRPGPSLRPQPSLVAPRFPGVLRHLLTAGGRERPRRPGHPARTGQRRRLGGRWERRAPLRRPGWLRPSEARPDFSTADSDRRPGPAAGPAPPLAPGRARGAPGQASPLPAHGAARPQPGRRCLLSLPTAAGPDGEQHRIDYSERQPAISDGLSARAARGGSRSAAGRAEPSGRLFWG